MVTTPTLPRFPGLVTLTVVILKDSKIVSFLFVRCRTDTVTDCAKNGEVCYKNSDCCDEEHVCFKYQIIKYVVTFTHTVTLYSSEKLVGH